MPKKGLRRATRDAADRPLNPIASDVEASLVSTFEANAADRSVADDDMKDVGGSDRTDQLPTASKPPQSDQCQPKLRSRKRQQNYLFTLQSAQAQLIHQAQTAAPAAQSLSVQMPCEFLPTHGVDPVLKWPA
jgi:hypothetical protein